MHLIYYNLSLIFKKCFIKSVSKTHLFLKQILCCLPEHVKQCIFLHISCGAHGTSLCVLSPMYVAGQSRNKR